MGKKTTKKAAAKKTTKKAAAKAPTCSNCGAEKNVTGAKPTFCWHCKVPFKK